MDNFSISLNETTAGQHNNEPVNYDPQSPLNSMTNAANVVLKGPGSTAGQQSYSLSAAFVPHRAQSPAIDQHETGGQIALIDEETRRLENKARQCVLEAVKAQKMQQQLLAMEALRAKEKRASRHITDDAPKAAQRFSFVPVEQWGAASRPGSFNTPSTSHRQSAAADSAALSRTQGHYDDPDDCANPPVILRKQKPVPRPRLSMPESPPTRPLPPSPPSLSPEMRPRLSRSSAQKNESLKTLFGLKTQPVPILRPRLLHSKLPQEVIPGTLEDLKKTFLSILAKRALEVKDFDNLGINYLNDIDSILQEKRDAMNKMIGILSKLEDHDDEVIMLNALIRIFQSAKNISDFFNVIANDTGVIMALVH
ncbi:hypothetical protein [Sodalis sp. dw_96]|uniref:hypothetical protein n=1 Tax=Sodalis sp. dw_96 TaxID=2719794 RepID=UPI001BD1F897|nr:hypothetical protein [Sodalis sp. dw_96]